MIVAVSMKQIINKVLMSVFSTVNAKAKEFVHRLAGAEAKTFVGTIRIRNATGLPEPGVSRLPFARRRARMTC